MWSRHIKSKLIVVLLRGDVVFGKNAFTGGRKCFITQVADLVAVCIYVSCRCVSAYKLTAKCASVGASVLEGVANVVELSLAVLACCRAGIQTNVSAVGVLCAADATSVRAGVSEIVSKAGAFAANCTDATALICRCGMECLNSSLLAAFVTNGIACAVISMCYRLAVNLKSLKAVLANGAANSLGSVCNCIALVFANCTLTGGTTLYITSGVASSGVDVSTNRLAATLNCADAVAIQRIVVEADMLADGLADVTDEVSVLVGVCKRLGSAASVTSQCVAKTYPYVLLSSLEATAVITDLVAGAGIKVIVVSSYKTAGTAGGAASELKVVHACGNQTGTAAMDAGNRAVVSVFVACFTGCIAEGASGGAGMKPCVRKLALGSLFAADIAISVAGVGIGVDHTGSLFAANAAGNRATFFVGVL